MAAPNDDELAPYFIEASLLKQRRPRGSGCYGAVYEVTVNGFPCIAKRLHEILVEQTVSVEEKSFIRSRFRDECLLLSKLRHPNVVQFIGVHYGRTQDDLTLVMEALYIDLGRCLAEQKLVKREIPLPIQLSILLDVSYGLLYLHSQSDPIIHRDLTARNVLLTNDMRAKLADLGVSKILGLHLLRSAADTVCPGTLGAMPPEALTKEPKYDIKLDNFSFGTLMLHVVNCEFPLPYEVCTEDCQRGTVSATRRRDAIHKMGDSHCLRKLVCQCLHDDPKMRPTTAKISGGLEKLSKAHPREFDDVLKMYQAIENLTSTGTHIAQQKLELQKENDRLSKENRDLLQKLQDAKSEVVQYEKDTEFYKDQFELFQEQVVMHKNQVEELTLMRDCLEEENSTLKTELESFRRDKEEKEVEMSLFNFCDYENPTEDGVEQSDDSEKQHSHPNSVHTLGNSEKQQESPVSESPPAASSYNESLATSTNGSEDLEFGNDDGVPEQNLTVPQQLVAQLQQQATDNDYYHLLGVQPEASAERLKTAWKEKSWELHPNHFRSDPGRRAKAEKQLSVLKQARDVFMSEEARRLYDKLCNYRKIPEQNNERLKNASEKLQVLHKTLRRVHMPLNLLEEVRLALTLVEHCLQSPDV